MKDNPQTQDRIVHYKEENGKLKSETLAENVGRHTKDIKRNVTKEIDGKAQLVEVNSPTNTKISEAIKKYEGIAAAMPKDKKDAAVKEFSGASLTDEKLQKMAQEQKQTKIADPFKKIKLKDGETKDVKFLNDTVTKDVALQILDEAKSLTKQQDKSNRIERAPIIKEIDKASVASGLGSDVSYGQLAKAIGAELKKQGTSYRDHKTGDKHKGENAALPLLKDSMQSVRDKTSHQDKENLRRINNTREPKER